MRKKTKLVTELIDLSLARSRTWSQSVSSSPKPERPTTTFVNLLLTFELWFNHSSFKMLLTDLEIDLCEISQDNA